jgi:hypothetical protein
MGGPEMLDVRGCRVAGETLCDIRGNRQRRPTGLISESGLLIARKSFGKTVTPHREIDRLLPDHDLSKRLQLGHATRSARDVPHEMSWFLVEAVCTLAEIAPAM